MSIAQSFALNFLRPYISRELPGWGYLYHAFVGDYHSDARWRGFEERWVRGKFHGYEMLLDLGQWSNRQTFFLKRFYDLPTQLFLQSTLKPGDSFIDIGANEGMMSLLASKLVGSDGRVYAFEPNPIPRERILAAINRNAIGNIEVRPYGLSNAAADLRLSFPKLNTGEGTFASSQYEADSTSSIVCQVRRGDDVIAGIKPSLIKIDVEGFELHALTGLEETIVAHRPSIVLETIADALARAGSSVEQINIFLRSKGYASYRLSLAKDKRLNLIPETPHTNAHGDYVWLPNEAALSRIEQSDRR